MFCPCKETNLTPPLFVLLKCLHQDRKLNDRVFLRVRNIDFASLYDFQTVIWICNDGLVFFFLLSILLPYCNVIAKRRKLSTFVFYIVFFCLCLFSYIQTIRTYYILLSANIVESGVKYHNPPPLLSTFIVL